MGNESTQSGLQPHLQPHVDQLLVYPSQNFPLNMHVAMITLRYLSALFGAFVLYLTYTMTEVEEGIWQNRLNELWIKVDEQRLNVGSTTFALFEKVAQSMSRSIDRKFGLQLVSLETVGKSILLSFGTGFFVMASKATLVGPFLVSFGIGYACLYAIRSREFSEWLGGVFLAIILMSPIVVVPRIRHFILRPQDSTADLFLSDLLIVLSILSDFLFIALVRRSLRWISNSISAERIVATLVTQSLVFVLVFVLPFSASQVTVLSPRYRNCLAGIVTLNLPTAIASLYLTAALALIVVHRMMWPVLSRLILPFTRKEVLDKRKTLRTIGWACIAVPLWGKELFPALGKIIAG